MWLKISNQGEVEKEGLYLIGASTKDGDDTKIGFFGSGNKYAIACLLRNNIPFRIFSGDQEIVINTKSVSLRDQTFQQIIVDGQSTSLTTRMGPSWEIWFAIREFYCNALDEGEAEMSVSEHEPVGESGKTSIFIDYVNSVNDFYRNIGTYILNSEPLMSVDTVYGMLSIHKKIGEKLAIFRKRIRVNSISDERNSIYDYNFDKIDINESRIIQYDYQLLQGVADFYVRCEDKEVISALLENINKSSFLEANLYWQWSSNDFSPAWKEAIGSSMVASRDILDKIPNEDLAHCVVLPHNLATKLKENVEGLNFYGLIKDDFIREEGTIRQKENLQSAKEECERFHFLKDAISEYELVLCRFKNDGLMGACQKEEKRILISTEFMDDYDELVITLFEEYAHAIGYEDDSRRFEQFLMRELVKRERKLNE